MLESRLLALLSRSSWLLAVVVLLPGCGTYYSYSFVPDREIHDFHLQSDPEGPAVARVTATLLGVMRPKSGHPRRVHARLRLDNRGADPMTLRTGRSLLRMTSLHELAPQGSPGDLVLEPGVKRTVDLFFELPSKDELPSAALAEFTLQWVLELAGKDRTSDATFQRTYYSRPVYYGYGGWSHGWYGPYYGPGFYGGYHRVIYCR